jgi:hypothetical protein
MTLFSMKKVNFNIKVETSVGALSALKPSLVVDRESVRYSSRDDDV